MTEHYNYYITKKKITHLMECMSFTNKILLVPSVAYFFSEFDVMWVMPLSPSFSCMKFRYLPLRCFSGWHLTPMWLSQSPGKNKVQFTEFSRFFLVGWVVLAVFIWLWGKVQQVTCIWMSTFNNSLYVISWLLCKVCTLVNANYYFIFKKTHGLHREELSNLI